MNSVRRHMILTALSLLAGTALVWWVEPNTGQGVTFIVSASVIFVNALGVLVWLLFRGGKKPHARNVACVLAVAFVTSVAAADDAPPPDARPIVLTHPEVSDTATLSGDGHTLHLGGIAGQSGSSAQTLQNYLAGAGDRLTCTQSGANVWRCVAPDGTDVAAVALFNGAAKALADAPAYYLAQQQAAQAARRGIWADVPPPAPAVRHNDQTAGGAHSSAPSTSEIVKSLRPGGGGGLARAFRPTTGPESTPPAPAAPAVVAAPPQAPPASEAPGSHAPLQIGRAFLNASHIPPKGVGAYGVLAMRAHPTSASHDRLVMACHSFLASLPPQSSLSATVALGDQMITVWPVMHEAHPDEDCEKLLADYDVHSGISAIADAQGQGHRLDGRGPFLIGWSPSSKRGKPDAIVLVIDMSGFDSQDSFDQAFYFWQQKVVEDPSLWRNGFSMEHLRLTIRDFSDHYGQQILEALKFWRNG